MDSKGKKTLSKVLWRSVMIICLCLCFRLKNEKYAIVLWAVTGNTGMPVESNLLNY